MRGNDAVAGSLVSCIDLEKRLRPQQPLRVIRGLVNRADHGQMESSERVRMLEKQICRTSCVNSCERNMLQAGLAVHLGDGGLQPASPAEATGGGGMTPGDCIAGGGRARKAITQSASLDSWVLMAVR
jgi:hypothetical protein